MLYKTVLILVFTENLSCLKMFVCRDSCPASDLVDDSGHELRVRLLIGQELPDDLVHDVLWWEEVFQKLGQNPGHHPSLAGQTLPDPGRTIGDEKQNKGSSLSHIVELHKPVT